MKDLVDNMLNNIGAEIRRKLRYGGGSIDFASPEFFPKIAGLKVRSGPARILDIAEFNRRSLDPALCRHGLPSSPNHQTSTPPPV